MLAIGKSDKYYTLWAVSIQTNYNGNGTSYDTANSFFIQNLSRDLKTAQKKAQEMGVEDLEPDEELYGRKYISYGESKQIDPSEEYQFPYSFIDSYQDIRTSENSSALWVMYLKKEIVFSADNPVNPEWKKPIIYARRRLADLGIIEKYKGQWMTPGYIEKVKDREFIASLETGHHFEAKQRVDLEIKQVNYRWFDSEWGGFSIVTYADIDGRKFTYMGGSPPAVSEDEFTAVKGTIKHDEYRDEKQTKLQRIKVLKTA